jgi:hypothetical protein
MPRIHRLVPRASRRSARALAAGLFLLLACLFASGHAAAQNELSLDAEAAFPSDERTTPAGAAAFASVTSGISCSFHSQPEIGANYHAFGGAPDAESFAVVAGGRVSIGFVLEPSAFLHAGVGHFGYDTALGDVSQTSLAYEAGLALDLTILTRHRHRSARFVRRRCRGRRSRCVQLVCRRRARDLRLRREGS